MLVIGTAIGLVLAGAPPAAGSAQTDNQLSIDSGSLVEPARHYGPNDRQSCTGWVQKPHPEYAPVTQLDSLEDNMFEFIGFPGDGKLCMADVFTVAPRGQGILTVYRAWNNGEGRKWGRWWSFDPPANFRNEANYRFQNGLCPSEGPTDRLDRVMACTLKVGAEFAVGPTQSKYCWNGSGVLVPQTATNQVYMPLGPASFSLWVERCEVFLTPFR